MKRTLLVVLTVLAIAGCSKNEIEIRNEAGGAVYFLFRGEQYLVSSGSDTTISDVPNGSYPFNTTFEVPPGMKSASSEDLDQELTFYRNQTHYTILYGSTSFEGNYVLNCSVSSTDPTNIVSE